jgi:hypothetical protein
MAISQINTNSIATGAVTSADLAAGAARANFGAGAVLQVVQGTSSTPLNLNTTTLTDIPATVTITPTSASSKILVIYNSSGIARGQLDSLGLQLLRNSTVVMARSRYAYHGSPDGNSAISPAPINVSYLDSPATTSAITYKVQAQIETTDGTAGWQINTSTTLPNISATNLATIIAMEIAA